MSTKLTERDYLLLGESKVYKISDDQNCFYRLGGHGIVAARYDRRSYPRLQHLGLVEKESGCWIATSAGCAALSRRGVEEILARAEASKKRLGSPE